MSTVIYVCWKETVKVFEGRKYPRSGQPLGDPIYSEQVIVKRARWSNEDTPEMLARANQWIASDRPEGWAERVSED